VFDILIPLFIWGIIAVVVIRIAPGTDWLHINRAHALMFSDRGDEARPIYLKHRNDEKTTDGKTWGQMITADFAELRTNGLNHPLMDEIEASLFSAAAPPLLKSVVDTVSAQ
jgi:hypothetical protein